MLKLIRYLIEIILIGYLISVFRAKNLKFKNIKIFVCIFTLFIIFIPFENLFLKFDKPEKAFNYSVSNAKIIKIIEEDNSALVIYSKKGSTYAMLLYGNDNKWKPRILPDSQILSRTENDDIYVLTKEKNSNNFYFMITLDSDVKALTDNYNSSFEIYFSNQYFVSYVAYVENCTGEYVINIDGVKYQII